jgi:hypothetical protein
MRKVRRHGKENWIALAAGLVLVLLCLLFWPVRIDPAAWNPSVLPNPFLRKVLVRLPEALRPAPPRSDYVLSLDMNGSVQYTLQDPKGEFYTDITTASEHSGMLYLGSSSEDAIGRLPVP